MKTCTGWDRGAAQPSGRWRAFFGRALVLALVLPALAVACRSSRPPPTSLLPEGWVPGQAQAVAVQGSACRARTATGPWRRLQVGDWIVAGATVEVPASAQLTLRLFDIGLKVDVKPDSLLRVEDLSYHKGDGKTVTSTVLNLLRGEVAVDRTGLAPGSRFDIRTPRGLTHIPPAAPR